MKQKITFISVMFFITSITATTILAQKGAEQQYAVPHGGFKNDISGKWNCGDFGTLTLSQKGNKVTGTYSVHGGKVSGTITQDKKFIGQWSETETGDKGDFEFETSIRRMTDRPTHLTGKWRYAGDKNWESGWDCSN
ncbi:hypothetical protein [Leptospira idonii]|uniref:Uncharacterized protein n=1 Tax=Leptospira idonii TaxID=1193500 RepID=A0A4R9M439_9LEPT|nr:hypothetical protein [Leptospira idonii]TGN20039.1 hypothetical protein EHS15_04900 [Leptospira idonii]